jgi:hypothetical protein
MPAATADDKRIRGEFQPDLDFGIIIVETDAATAWSLKYMGARAEPLMSPTLFVEFGLKPFRHLRVSAIINRVAARARRSGAATGAGVLAFPGSIRVGFTNPTAVLAE